MLQALLDAQLQAQEGGKGGVSSLPDVQTPLTKAVLTAGVDVRGVRGEPERIHFWHDLFRHVNGSWFKTHGQTYPWNNRDRKVMANAARKYGAATIMAMWTLYQAQPAAWHKLTGGTIYGMVRDSGRLLDLPRFKSMQRYFKNELDQAHPGLASTGEILGALKLTAKRF